MNSGVVFKEERHNDLWKSVCEGALSKVRSSTRLGRVAHLVEGLAGKHRLYYASAEELRELRSGHAIPPTLHLFLGRSFVGLQRAYNLLEINEMKVGENVLPGSLLIQGQLVPSAVKGRDEHNSSVEVSGVLLLLYSSLATMPAQVSGIDNVSEAVVNFAPNEITCTFYDPSTDNLVIGIIA